MNWRPGIALIVLNCSLLMAGCGGAAREVSPAGTATAVTEQPTIEPEPTPRATEAPTPTAAGFSAVPRQEFGDGEALIELDLKPYYSGGAVDELQFTWENQGDSQLQIEIEDGVLRAKLPDLTWHGSEVILLEACEPSGPCAGTEFEVFKSKEAFPPTITGFGEQIIFGGESLQAVDLDQHVIDLDHEPGELTWMASSPVDLQVEIASRKLSISAADPEWRGSETIELEVCDPDELCDKSEVEFSVIAQADAALTYVVNEGFILESGGKKVLLDGLLSTIGYYELPISTQRAMSTGQAPFDAIDLVLTTHNHDDHFDPLIAGAFLAANPQTRFVTTPQTVSDLMVNYPEFEVIEEQVIEVYPEAGEQERLVVNGIEIRVFNLPHGSYQNLGFMVDLGGVRFLHTGDYYEDDADSAIELLQVYEFPLQGIDVAFIAEPFLRYERFDQLVAEGIRPGVLVPMHYIASHPNNWIQSLAERYPDSILFTRELERIELSFPQ
jgi:L-ascorbate metabolism protein UlaG (beta-lactamase superfamily)